MLTEGISDILVLSLLLGVVVVLGCGPGWGIWGGMGVSREIGQEVLDI